MVYIVLINTDMTTEFLIYYYHIFTGNNYSDMPTTQSQSVPLQCLPGNQFLIFKLNYLLTVNFKF